MPPVDRQTGFAAVDEARLYYEVSGAGQALVMIHAGVADRRQWDNEFDHFAACYRVLRYDLRGYGKSEPVDGEFSNMADLCALLESLQLRDPLILMGCSMGGGLALDFALAFPSRVKALVLVGAGPSGLQLEVPPHPRMAEAEKAYLAGDLDRVAELETQIWFDGMGRSPDQVDPAKRALAYEMNRLGLAHDARHLGKKLPDAAIPAAGRLDELEAPVLVVVGAHDTPFILAAADHMHRQLRRVRKVTIDDAAHLANMDRPDEFRLAVTEFLDSVVG